MSKVTKFLSLGIDMLQALPESEFTDREKNFKDKRIYLSADRMEKAMQAVETYLLGNNNLTYSEVKPTESGEVSVFVTVASKPAVADVRFYPVKPGEKLESAYTVTGRIDMTRLYTGDDGKLSTTLPAGRYLVKISKGTEYEIFYQEINVSKKEPVSITAELIQFTDLEKEGYFAGDLHHHSIYSSPVWGGTDDVVESPKEVSDSMRANGLKFGALSDHHNILNHKEWKATKTCDFHPIPSKEISTSNGHVLALGVDEYDVIYKIPSAADRTEKYLRNEFIRITDEIKEKGGLAQLNHPRDLQVSISWNKDFYDMTGIFETIEIWNGSNPMYYGSTNAKAGDFWRSLLEKGQYIPITSGSDCHNTKANDYHLLYGKMLWLKGNVENILNNGEIRRFEDYRKELEAFVFICNKLLPMLEVWAKTTLTSGCVRTYVHIDGEPDTPKILEALKHGHSFLTTGPVLFAEINGASLGDTVKVESGKADVKLTIRSNRSLSKVIAYTSKNRACEIPLKELPKAPSYDYSFELKDYDLSDTDYIFFVAAGDVTNLAITNPILIKH